MHRILERQIKRALGQTNLPEMPAGWDVLLQSVSDAYVHADEDRTLLSRSLDLSSKEFVDINERLRSENEIIEAKVRERTADLEYEKAKLNTIAQNMPTGAILIDKNASATFLNQVAVDLLGSSSLHDALQTLDTMFPAISVYARIAEALKGNTSIAPKIEGKGRVFLISFASLQDSHTVLGALIWINDITAQSVLDQARNQFIAIASHEMRTPLAIIRGNAELMLDEEVIRGNPELTEETKRILKSAVRLLGIVNDFLDLQNVEGGRIVLKPSDVDLIQVVRDTMGDLRTQATEKEIALIFEPSNLPIMPHLWIDKTRLGQIFTNFISNAIHYTTKGSITISIEKTDTAIKVFFTDTGIGIDEEDQERLFKKFATAKIFLQSKEYGSGLGLYISSLLASAMECSVHLEHSEVGVGSTFSITIPTTLEIKAPSA